jgi:CDP-4-dehydro-6-deoxyglucose reductase/terephthalate 1,2-dioxygenase reductase component
MVAAVREAALARCGLDATDFHSDVFVEGPAA